MNKLLIILLSVLATLGVNAQESAKIASGPWLSAVGETEFTAVWTTSSDAVAWVEIAPEDGTHFYMTQRRKFYQSDFGLRHIGTLHSVKVSGLSPATTYRYRIMIQDATFDPKNGRVKLGECRGSDVFRREPYSVTTLDTGKKSIKFAVGNDFHEGDSIFRVLFANTGKADYDFVCLNGDMTSNIASRQAVLDNYMSSAAKLFANRVPLYMVRGNHETRGKQANVYMDMFPTSTGQPYYSFRQGPVFFIVLDGGEDKPDSDIDNRGIALFDEFREQQASWLENVVASQEFKQSPVRIVFCHMPPETKGWHGSAEVSRLFVPILNHAGIDLMISGHIHDYSFEDKGTDGREFPVLCNPNRCRMDVQASAEKIDISLFNKAGDECFKKLSIAK